MENKMSGVLIDVEVGSDGAARSLADLNKQLAELIRTSTLASKGIGGISAGNFKTVTANTKEATAALSAFGDTGSKSFKNLEKSSKDTASSMAIIPKLLGGIAAGFALIQGVKSFYSIQDSLTQLQNRLRLVTKDASELTQVQHELYRSSRETNASMEVATEIYFNLSRSLKSAGESTTSMLGTAKTLQQIMTLSGGSIEATNAGMMQFNQALASGVLRGDEFRSVMENLPRLAQAIADGLHISQGELRNLANDGKLASSTVLSAIKDQTSKIQTEFKSIQVTAAQGVTATNAAFGNLLNTVTSITKSNSHAGQALQELANGVDSFAAKVVPSFYIATQGFQNYIRNIDMFSAAQLTLRGLFALKITPFSAYQSYQEYDKLKGYINEFRHLLGLAKKESRFDFIDTQKASLKSKISDLTPDFAKPKQADFNFPDFLKTAGSLILAVGHAVSGLSSKFSKLIPDIRLPIKTFSNDLNVFFTQTAADATAMSATVFTPIQRGIEAVFQTMTLFTNGDNQLERGFVNLLKSSSIKDLIGNLNALGDAGNAIRFDNLDILKEDIRSWSESSTEDTLQVLRYFGLLENRLLFVNNIRFDRAIETFKTLGSIAKRVYTDIIFPILLPKVTAVYLYVKALAVALADGIKANFTTSNGEIIGKKIVDGIVIAMSTISRVISGLVSGDSLNLSFSFKDDFKSTAAVFLNRLTESVVAVLEFIEGVFKGAFSRIAKNISSTFGNPFTKVFSSLREEFQQIFVVSPVIDSMYRKMFGGIVSRSFKYTMTLDPSALQETIRIMDELLMRILVKTYSILAQVESRIRSFSKLVKNEFFDIYDKVVGHSYWPDMVDGVNEYTTKLLQSEGFVGRFANSIKSSFKSIYAAVSNMGGKAGTAFTEIKVRLESIDIEALGTNLRKVLSASILAALMFTFGGGAAKLIALDFAESLVSLQMQSTTHQLPGIVASAFGEASGTIAATLAASLFQMLDSVVAALPAFTTAFLGSFGVLGQTIASLFSVVTGGNGLLYTLIYGAGAYAFKAKDGLKTITELFTGVEANKKKKTPAKEGILSYGAAIFDIDTKKPSLFKAILGENPALLAIGIAAISSSYLKSIGLMEAAVVGIPLMTLAIFGKDAGGRLIRETVVNAYNGLLSYMSTRSLAVQAGLGAGMFGIIGLLSGHFSALQLVAITALGAIAPVAATVMQRIGIQLASSLGSGARGPVATAFADLANSGIAALMNAQKNKAAYGAGQISTAQLFSSMWAGPVQPPASFGAKIVTAFDAVLDASFKGVSLRSVGTSAIKMGETLVAGIVSGLTTAAPLIRNVLSDIMFKAEIALIDIGAAARSVKDAIVGFFATMGTGAKTFFSILTNKFTIFAILAAGFATMANASVVSGSALSDTASQLKTILLISAGIAATFWSIGKAAQAVAAFKVAKDSVLGATIAGATKTPEAILGIAQASADAFTATKQAGGSTRAAKKAGSKAASAAEAAIISTATAGISWDANLAGMKAFAASVTATFRQIGSYIVKALQVAGGAVITVVGAIAGSFVWMYDVIRNKRWAEVFEGMQKAGTAMLPYLTRIGGVLLTIGGIIMSTLILPLKAAVLGFQALSASVGVFAAIMKTTFAGLQAVGAVLLRIGGFFITLTGFVATLAVLATGALGLWLFGPGESLMDDLEYFKDKLISIFDMKPTGSVARLGNLKELLQTDMIGTVPINFEASLSKVDLSSMKAPEYALLQKTAETTRDTIARIKEAQFIQGHITAEQTEELKGALKLQQSIIDAQPRKKAADFAAEIERMASGFEVVNNGVFAKAGRVASDFFSLISEGVGRIADGALWITNKILGTDLKFDVLSDKLRNFALSMVGGGDAVGEFVDRMKDKMRTLADSPATVLHLNPFVSGGGFDVAELEMRISADKRAAKLKAAADLDTSRKATYGSTRTFGTDTTPGLQMVPLIAAFLKTTMDSSLSYWKSKDVGPTALKQSTADTLRSATQPFSFVKQYASTEGTERVLAAAKDYETAATKYNTRAEGGYVRFNKGVEVNFKNWQQQLVDLKQKSEEAADTLARVASEEAAVAQLKFSVKEYGTHITNVQSDAKLASGVDIGELGKGLFGNVEQEVAFNAISQEWKALLQKLKDEANNANVALPIRLKMEKLSNQQKRMKEELDATGFFEQQIDWQLKVSGIDTTRDALTDLFIMGGQGWDDWQVALKETKAATDALTDAEYRNADATEIAALVRRKNAAKVRQEAVRPTEGLFNDVSKGFAKVGLTVPANETFLGASEVQANELTAAMKKAAAAKEALEKPSGQRPFATLLADLRNSLADILALKNIAFNTAQASLKKPGLTEAERDAIKASIGIAPASVQVGSTEKNAQRYDALSDTGAKLRNRLENAKANNYSAKEIAGINKALATNERQQSDLQEAAARVTTLANAVSSSGLQLSVDDLARVSSSVYHDLVQAGTVLADIEYQISKLGSGATQTQLAPILARKFKETERVFKAFLETLGDTSGKIVQIMSSFGVSTGAQLSALTPGLLAASLGINKLTVQIDHLKTMDIAKVGFEKMAEMMMKLEILSDHLKEKLDQTFSGKFGRVNQTFSLNIDEGSFARLDDSFASSLNEAASNVKLNLAKVQATGRSFAGESAAVFYTKLEDGLKRVKFVSFFATLATGIAGVFTDGFKTQFDTIAQSLGELPFDAGAFSKVDPSKRAAVTKDAVNIKGLSDAMNLPGLDDNARGILASFTNDAEATLKELKAYLEKSLPDIAKLFGDAKKTDSEKLAGSNQSLEGGIKSLQAEIAKLTKQLQDPKTVATVKEPVDVKSPAAVKRNAKAVKSVELPSVTISIPKEYTKADVDKEGVTQRNTATSEVITTANEITGQWLTLSERLSAAMAQTTRDTIALLGIDEGIAATAKQLGIDVDLMSIRLARQDDKNGFVTQLDEVKNLSIEQKANPTVERGARLAKSTANLQDFADQRIKPQYDATRNAGKNFAATMISGVGDGLKGLLKGQTSFEDFGRSLLDKFTSGVIDTFVDGAMKSFSKTAGSMLTDFASGLFESGGKSGGGLFSAIGSLFLAGGGSVNGPGTGTSDSIPAMLSNGEFVVNAAATKEHRGLLDKINTGKVPKFATGGIVGNTVVMPLAMPGTMPTKLDKVSTNTSTFNINITGDVSRQTRAEIQQMIPQIATGVNMHNYEQRSR